MGLPVKPEGCRAKTLSAIGSPKLRQMLRRTPPLVQGSISVAMYLKPGRFWTAPKSGQ